MGITRFKGPVYGAKGNLFTWGPYTQTGASGASTVAYLAAGGNLIVPPYEDWFITECILTASTNSTVAAGNAIYLKTEGGSTSLPTRTNGQPSTVTQTVFSFANASGSSAWSTWATASVSQPGEYEGTYVPAGSSIRIVTSGITLVAGLQLNVRGFTRFVDLTRAS